MPKLNRALIRLDSIFDASYEAAADQTETYIKLTTLHLSIFSLARSIYYLATLTQFKPDERSRASVRFNLSIYDAAIMRSIAIS